jgi:hypothetical protein
MGTNKESGEYPELRINMTLLVGDALGELVFAEVTLPVLLVSMLSSLLHAINRNKLPVRIKTFFIEHIF